MEHQSGWLKYISLVNIIKQLFQSEPFWLTWNKFPFWFYIKTHSTSDGFACKFGGVHISVWSNCCSREKSYIIAGEFSKPLLVFFSAYWSVVVTSGNDWKLFTLISHFWNKSTHSGVFSFLPVVSAQGLIAKDKTGQSDNVCLVRFKLCFCSAVILWKTQSLPWFTENHFDTF